MEKKYQVFISSTFNDLKVEREKAINAILTLEHIPIGMELFTASDNTQWAIIERAIDNTDYYILIIGFRYGSLTQEDISYTEKEYDYAISKGIPVLAFIKDRDMPVADADRESTMKCQKKLDAFIKKVKKKEVNWWKTPDELALQITSSLMNEIKIKPRTGWVRADFDPIAISQEMAVLSKENRELRKIVDNIGSKQPKLTISIDTPNSSGNGDTLTYKYQPPENNINVHPLTVEDDLIDEVKNEVSPEDLLAYNEGLPTQEEIEDYNTRNTLYENSQKNAFSFQLQIDNSGNGKANNIFVDLHFPSELLAYYDYDIEDIEKPQDLKLPVNPVWKALKKLRASKLPKSVTASLIPLEPIWKDNMLASYNMPLVNTDRLQPGYYTRDHDINGNHDTTVLELESLIHSRNYTSDEIWFIATQKGAFTIECTVMCEEYEEPSRHSFKLVIE